VIVILVIAVAMVETRQRNGLFQLDGVQARGIDPENLEDRRRDLLGLDDIIDRYRFGPVW
jgi:hypothetical protein